MPSGAIQGAGVAQHPPLLGRCQNNGMLKAGRTSREWNETMTNLSGRVALVTGGAQGIGRGIAISLAEAGVDIAIADRIPSNAAAIHDGPQSGPGTSLDETIEHIRSLGRRALAISADVTRKDDNRRMVEHTVRELGNLDILVCNAGVLSVSEVESLSEADWDHTFAVNIKGVFLACQAAIPTLKRSAHGCIINIASVAGKNGYAGLAHYCASKFAVVGFTNALARELAPASVRVNAICPGIVRTQMWDQLAEAGRRPTESREDAWRRAVAKRVPLGRPQTPGDIGACVCYLAAAENITGQAINVDGGMELH